MPKLSRFLTLAVLAIVLSACGTGPRSTDSPTPRRNAQLISEEEVAASSVNNAYELVQLLRPGWLRKQGAYSFGNDGDIVVYLNDTRMGGPGVLRDLSLTGVRTIRYMDSLTASARYGLNHTYGAIQVESR